MDRKVACGRRSGRIKIPASKSYAHRLLICSAFADNETTIACDGMSKDIIATIDCLRAPPVPARSLIVQSIIVVIPAQDWGKAS